MTKTSRRKNVRTALAVGALVFVALGVVIGIAIWQLTQDTSEAEDSYLKVKSRIDCFPEASGGVDQLTRGACEERGCVYNPHSFLQDAPDCYVPQDGTFGFKVTTQSGDQTWQLERTSERGVYGENFQKLTFTVEDWNNNAVRIKIAPTDTPRYEVPMEIEGKHAITDKTYEVEVTNEPFSFRIIRKSTGTAIWDTSVGGLAFTDQFIQIATRLPSSYMYGMGENLHRSFRHDTQYQTWPMFSRDQIPWSGETNKRFNLYSVHPFYEGLEEDGNAHGVLLLNSNAMDYTVTPAPMLVYRTIGGILDFYIFLGPTPENVVQQYTEAIGRPMMPPYWSLGFQLCRYGFRDLTHMQEAVNRTIQYDIPLDVVYGDIDYMDHQRDFTVDPVNYAGLPDYFKYLRQEGLHTIIILDPCIEVNDTDYPPFVSGQDGDVYVKWPEESVIPEGHRDPDKDAERDSLYIMGYVWPEEKVVFPDFFKNKTRSWWAEELKKFRKNTLEFDGLWIDMNEPANFGTNEEKPWNWPEGKEPWSLQCPESMLDDPPFRTKAAYQYDDAGSGTRKRLSGSTICMVGVHGDNDEYTHYDVHSLYGLKQSQASIGPLREAVNEEHGKNLRSILVSRSTYPGSGSVTGRWLGDNGSDWPDMHLSIIGMLEFNLFGFSYIGADICGFFGQTWPELCRRWQELGAFYPYSRNHNQADNDDQDPGYFGEYVAGPTRNALNIRYTLLPYLYTLFHHAHTEGSTVVRSLMHEFTSDRQTWSIDRQFLWGSAFLITPIMEEKASRLDYYLPEGRWYKYRNGAAIEGGRHMTMNVNLETPIQLHVRGGYILPTQKPGKHTTESRGNHFGLKVALDRNDDIDGHTASGGLFWDDGETLDTFKNDAYYTAEFKCEDKTLTFAVTHDWSGMTLKLDTVEIWGVTANTTIEVDGTAHGDATFDSTNKCGDHLYTSEYAVYRRQILMYKDGPRTERVLHINQLNKPMDTNFTLTWE